MKLLVLLYAVGFIVAIDIVLEKHDIEYINRKYIRNMTVSFRKFSRNSPHYINLEVDAIQGVGNNLTLNMALFEHLGGHYIPTPIMVTYKLCDFLYKEPFFGKMYSKQFTGNWSCPFPAGVYHFMNLTIHLENFPYNIPFTYSSLTVRARSDVQGFLSTTNEEVFRWKTFVKLTQKLQTKDGKRIKFSPHSSNKKVSYLKK